MIYSKAPVCLFLQLRPLPPSFYSQHQRQGGTSLRFQFDAAASSAVLSIRSHLASQNLAPWEYNFDSTVVENERTMKATARKIAGVAARRQR